MDMAGTLPSDEMGHQRTALTWMLQEEVKEAEDKIDEKEN